MANEESPALIPEWYTDRCIFVTGGSGFMGKVLLEKLLYACPKLKAIYMLMRSKRGKTPERRLEEMFKSPVFSRIAKNDAQLFKKIIPVIGDVSIDQFGLSESDLEMVKRNTHIIFHCAATLKLDAPLKDAVQQNTAGTLRLIEMAHEMPNLKAFVHFSTAFCSADLPVFDEKVYECSDNPRDVIDVVRWMRDDALAQVTPKLIAPHPNTYTYTKRLAETLIGQEAGRLPVCIVRPAVVTPAGLEPLPGWVDSLNGPMGLIVGAGKGVIRSMHCKPENRAQIVPVDVAISAAIVIAHEVATGRATCHNPVPVYNLSQDEVIHITYGEIISRGRHIAYEHPFEMQIWYPDGNIRSSYTMHWLCCIFFHWLPAYIIDFLMLLLRQKTFMVNIQKKIHQGLNLLQFFTVREWIFKTTNFLALSDHLSAADKKIFPMDFHLLSVEEYMTACALGARQYIMKEDPSTLPRCRIQQNILFVVHKTFVYGFYFTLFWLLINSCDSLRYAFDFILHSAKRLPIIGTLLAANPFI